MIFTGIILQVVKVMKMLLVSLLTQQMAVVISVVIVKQLKRSYFSQLKKKPNFTRRYEEGYNLPDPRYKAWLEIMHPRVTG